MGEAESTESYVKRYSLDRLLSPGLLAALNLRRYGKGEHIIRSGESVEELLFFVDGRAKVYNQMENGSALLVRFYRPFDILGDVELFSFERYILDVVALEDTVCLGLPADAIRRGAEDNAGLLMELCGRLGRKLADFNVSAAINLRYPVENRLASYLLAVSGASDSGADVYGTDDIGELADMLGSSRRQLSRAIRDFRDRGILEEKRGRIRVASREKLEPLARDLYI
ncbi:MAG: cyclic nucleotide-binding domain-containing protein [Rectinemataceae bacterium]